MIRKLLLTWLVAFLFLWDVCAILGTTNWSKLNGTSVGSSSGNLSKWNGVSIGTLTGNISAWNGLASPSSISTPSLINTCKATNISGSSFSSLTCGSSLTVLAGDTLIAEYRYEASALSYPSQTQVQDNVGDYFLMTAQTTGSGSGWALGVAVICGAIGGTTTPSFYLNNQSYPSLIVHQYRGAAYTPNSFSCVDQTSTATANSTSVTSGSFTPGATTEVSFAAAGVNNTGVTFTAGSGYTKQASDNGTTGMVATEDKVTLTTSSQTASMSFSSNPAAIVVTTLKGGTTASGHGIPSGHRMFLWGASTSTSTQCGSPGCVLKVTDSAGNTWSQPSVASNTQLDSPSSNVSNFLASAYASSSIASDGSGWVKGCFYQHDGTTAITDPHYLRLFDMSNAANASLDSSTAATGSGTTAQPGSLTVGGGNTDLIFLFGDFSSTSPTVSAGAGQTLITLACPKQTSCIADTNGGQQGADYSEQTGNFNPSLSLTSSASFWVLGAAAKESGSGGTIQSVNSIVPVSLNSACVYVQVPAWY